MSPALQADCLLTEPPSAHFFSSMSNVGKNPDAGKDGGQKEKGAANDEMLDSIIDSMDMSLSKLQETVEDRGAWCVTVHGVATVFHRGQTAWYFHQQFMRVPIPLHPHQHLLFSGVFCFIIAILMNLKWILIVVSICFFLQVSGSLAFFHVLLGISSLQKCLFSSLRFTFELVGCSLLSCRSSSCILSITLIT